MLKRSFDFIVAFGALIALSPLLVALAVAVRATSTGPALYWSKRVGRDNALFSMPKFRTMRTDTPQIATHLLADPKQWITSVGPTLRRLSLDELPQLLSVLTGDMSLVGPRPALFNQDDLVALRTEVGVHKARPGITGWAQINGRDELPIPIKVRFDQEYLAKASFLFDLKIILGTFTQVLASRGVSH